VHACDAQWLAPATVVRAATSRPSFATETADTARYLARFVPVRAFGDRARVRVVVIARTRREYEHELGTGHDRRLRRPLVPPV